MTNERSPIHDMSREPDRHRRPRGAVSSLVFGVLILVLLVWQFAGVSDDGLQFQVLDPHLGLIWKALMVVFVSIGTVCSLVAWVVRRWTLPLATANTVANAGAAGVIVVLALRGELFAPTLPAQVGTIFETSTDWTGLTEPFILVVLAVAVWDSVDGIRQARGGVTPPAGAPRRARRCR